jgi:hypothetical protein
VGVAVFPLGVTVGAGVVGAGVLVVGRGGGVVRGRVRTVVPELDDVVRGRVAAGAGAGAGVGAGVAAGGVVAGTSCSCGCAAVSLPAIARSRESAVSCVNASFFLSAPHAADAAASAASAATSGVRTRIYFVMPELPVIVDLVPHLGEVVPGAAPQVPA